MQDSADEDNSADPTASEKLPLAGGSRGNASSDVCETRYVSEVNCKCPPASDADVDDKDAEGVCDAWLTKLVADASLVGSTDELTDGSGCMSLTEPSSSQVGSIVTVISQNHVTGDCFSNECSMDAAAGLKDGVQNSYEKDKSRDARALDYTVKRNSHSGCDGGAGRCCLVLVFICTMHIILISV